MDQLLVSDVQLGRRLGVSRATIWNCVRRGELPAPKKIGRSARWDLAAVMASLGISAPPPAVLEAPPPPADSGTRGRGRPRKVKRNEGGNHA